MAEEYSLNQNSLPGEPVAHDEHSKLMVIVLIVAVIAITGVIVYWQRLSSQPTAAPETSQTNLQKQMAVQVVKMLQNAKLATDQQINSVVTSLSKATPATAAQKQSIVSQLSEQ